VTARLPAAVDLTVVAGRVAFAQDDLQPGGSGPIQNADFAASGDIHHSSLEVRLSRLSPRYTWIAGGQYDTSVVRQHTINYSLTNSVTNQGVGALSFGSFLNDGRQESRSTGVFGQVEWAPRADAPVTEKLGMVLIRIMPDPKQAAPKPNEVPMVRVVTPSGKVGYISADVLAPLGNDQLCYVKDASGWKIAGFIGTGPGSQ